MVKSVLKHVTVCWKDQQLTFEVHHTSKPSMYSAITQSLRTQEASSC